MNQSQYFELVSSFAEDAKNLGEDHDTYAFSSEYAYIPSKALQLLAVSPSAFKANENIIFSNISASDALNLMATNALVADMDMAARQIKNNLSSDGYDDNCDY